MCSLAAVTFPYTTLHAISFFKMVAKRCKKFIIHDFKVGLLKMVVFFIYYETSSHFPPKRHKKVMKPLSLSKCNVII